jgi:hypothetical protein
VGEGVLLVQARGRERRLTIPEPRLGQGELAAPGD